MLNPKARPCDEAAIRAVRSASDCRPSSKPWVLAVTIMASTMAYIDESVVNVALPTIEADLKTSAAVVQWLINAYMLSLTALVLVGGAAGDQLGRRRVFVAATRPFAPASLWGGGGARAPPPVFSPAPHGGGAGPPVPPFLPTLRRARGRRAVACGFRVGGGAQPRADDAARAVQVAHVRRRQSADAAALCGARRRVLLPAVPADPGARIFRDARRGGVPPVHRHHGGA